MELQLIQDLLSTLMLPSRLDEIHLDEIQRSIFIKRDDLIHPVISGNKWRKLDGHIQEFIRSGANRMVSMGVCTPIICMPWLMLATFEMFL